MKTTLLLVCLLVLSLASNIRKDSGSLDAPKKAHKNLYTIDLQKIESSTEEKAKVLQLVKVKQSYLYGDSDYTNYFNSQFGYFYIYFSPYFIYFITLFPNFTKKITEMMITVRLPHTNPPLLQTNRLQKIKYEKDPKLDRD